MCIRDSDGIDPEAGQECAQLLQALAADRWCAGGLAHGGGGRWGGACFILYPAGAPRPFPLGRRTALAARPRPGGNPVANAIRIFGSKVARPMATRSISVSLDEELLAALDAQGGNRSASVTEAIQLWLRRRELERLQEAYDQLAQIQGGDLDHAMADGAAMGAAALQGLDG